VALIAGFALGVAAMLALEQVTRRLQTTRPASGSDPAVGLLAAIGIDVAIDGLLIGVAFAAGARQGKLLVVAVTTEVLALGLAVATDLNDRGCPPRSVLAGGAMPGPVLAVTAILGAGLLGGLPAWALTAVIAFAAAALLYLVTEELVVEAHETADAPWITGCFFAGFLVLLIFQTQ
jgi:ZIP family zinc transporter